MFGKDVIEETVMHFKQERNAPIFGRSLRTNEARVDVIRVTLENGALAGRKKAEGSRIIGSLYGFGHVRLELRSGGHEIGPPDVSRASNRVRKND